MPAQEGGNTTFAAGVIISNSANSLRAVANNQNLGDKISFWGDGINGHDYGFGVQGSRVVVYMASGSAFAVRVAASTGHASSGTDIVTLGTNGQITATTIVVQQVLATGNPGSKTTTYTMVSTDRIVLCNAASGAFTVTLPGVVNGLLHTIKKTDSSANAVTVARSGTSTIDGATTKTLAAQWNSITVYCDGTNWYVVGTT